MHVINAHVENDHFEKYCELFTQGLRVRSLWKSDGKKPVEMQTSGNNDDHIIQIEESRDEDMMERMAHEGLTITTRGTSNCTTFFPFSF